MYICTWLTIKTGLMLKKWGIVFAQDIHSDFTGAAAKIHLQMQKYLFILIAVVCFNLKQPKIKLAPVCKTMSHALARSNNNNNELY